MADGKIELDDLPVATPGAYDYLVGTQLGNARKWPLPEVNNAAALLAAAIHQIVTDAQDEMEAVLSGLGYEPSVPYGADITLTRTTQTVERAGYIYAPLTTAIPFTTTGVWASESDKFRLVQGVTTAQLASLSGAAMVGFKQAGAGAQVRTMQSKGEDDISLLDFIPPEQHAAIRAGTSTFDCAPAMRNALATIALGTGFYRGGPKIKIPAGEYYFASPIELKTTVIIEGESSHHRGGYATTLKFATSGFTVNRYNTINGGVESPATTGADGSIFRNLRILGLASKGSGEYGYFGIWLRARATIEDCIVERFTGNGVQITSHTSDPARIGNANCWSIKNLTVLQNGRIGLYIDGVDSNAGTAIAVNATGNGEWGVFDSSFLANTHIGHHLDANGWLNTAMGDERTSVVSHGGNRYCVVIGKAAQASTTEPGTDASVWDRYSSGGVNAQIPAWVSGISTKEGGGACGLSANAPKAWVGCYHETGQGKSHISHPHIVIGGQMALSLTAASTALVLRSNADGSMQLPRGVAIARTDNGVSRQVDLAFGLPSSFAALRFLESNNFPNGVRWGVSAGDHWIRDFTFSSPLITFTGQNTERTYGRSGTVPNTAEIPSLHLGQGNNARQLTSSNVAPTSGSWARGDVVFNRSATAGGKLGWVCVTAGTPGTWKPFGAIDP